MLEFSTNYVISFFLLFCRVGTICMFAPGLSQANVPTNVRLAFALALTMAFYQSIGKTLLAPSEKPIVLILLILGEIMIGFVIGFVTKIIMGAAHTLGLTISASMGLSSAMLLDPSQGSQGSIIGNFISVTFTTIFYSTYTHYIIIQAMLASYEQFHLGTFWEFREEFVTIIVKAISTAWNTGVTLSAPFIVISVLMYLSAGILSRLMPQLQIFFLILPMQILVGFFLLMITLGGISLWFVDHFEEVFSNYFNFR